MTPDRFFALMLLLESRDGATTQDLASALGVSLRTINRDLNWLRDAGLPVTAHRGRLGGVAMLPGSGLDLTRLTPGERDHLSLLGLDEKQRAELDASVESGRALAKPTLPTTMRGHRRPDRGARSRSAGDDDDFGRLGCRRPPLPVAVFAEDGEARRFERAPE